MKKTLFITTLFCSALSFSQNVWIQRDQVNGPPKSACASFIINDEGWVATGYDGMEDKRSMYSYDLEQDDWDKEVSLGGEAGSGLNRKSAVGFAVKEKGYVALGSGIADYFKDVWQYDDETKSWTQMADFAGSARRGAVAFSVDSLAYVGSGLDENGVTNDFYSFNPNTNEWTSVSDFPGDARREAVGFTMGGRGYFGTGRGDGGYYRDFWEYYPLTDSWKQLADFPGTPRMGACGTANFPSAFVMLGEDNSLEYKQDVWEYNYFGNSWSQRADFPGEPRSQAVAFTVQNRIFCGTGYGGEWYNDFYEYEYSLSDGPELIDLPLQLYPNPTNGPIILSFNHPISAFQYKIMDLNGRILLADNYSGNNTIQLDLSQLVPSTYFISVLTEDGIQITKQFVLQ